MAKEIITYPNQSIITIHKPEYEGNFVQVSIDEWQEAFAALPRISFGLYLYLCGNKDGFHLALSSVAFQHSLGVSDSSYRRAVEDLLAAGYLIMRNGKKNTMDFFTSPQFTTYVKKERKKKADDDEATSAINEAAEPDPLSFEEEEYMSYYQSSPSFSSYTWEP